MKDYTAYLFDWDGTLACTVELWLDQIYQQYGNYGLTISHAENAREFGNLKAPLKYGLPTHKLNEFQEGVNLAMLTLLPNAPLYDKAEGMLRHLKAEGKQLALITTSLRHNLDLVMRKHGIEELFDLIVTSEDVRTHKPNPEGIMFALERLGASPEAALMVGDSDKDLLAAQNAGIDSALFYPEAHQIMYDLSELQTHRPKYIITAWQELLDQLQ